MRDFCCFCCHWRPALDCGDPIGYMELFQFSCIRCSLFCDREDGQLWSRYHEVLRRYILLVYDKIFFWYVITWSITAVSFILYLFSLGFHDLSNDEDVVLKSPTIIVWDAMHDLSFSKVYFMNVGAYSFVTYMFTQGNLELQFEKLCFCLALIWCFLSMTFFKWWYIYLVILDACDLHLLIL